MFRKAWLNETPRLRTFTSLALNSLGVFISQASSSLSSQASSSSRLAVKAVSSTTTYLKIFPSNSLSFHPNRLFNSPAAFSKDLFPTSYYVMGPPLTPDLVKSHQGAIQNSKTHLKDLLDCKKPDQKDLSLFVDLLFDVEKSQKILNKIDGQTQRILKEIQPQLFQAYQTARSQPQKTEEFLKRKFLPTLRTVFQRLASHYGFDSALIETNDGVLLDDDYMDFVQQGKLVLDLGEDGHGPLPHIIAVFMMKELELAGEIASAKALYCSLAQKCNYYCIDRADLAYRFLLLLDYPNSYPLTHTQLCNPSSLANQLLSQGQALKALASICKTHSHALAKLSTDEWEQKDNKRYLVRGKVLEF
jgi:hypothetical protein